MPDKTRSLLRILAILFATLFLVFATLSALAQDTDTVEDSAAVQEPTTEIFITGNDITKLPSVVVHMFGRDATGQAIDFSQETLAVTHNGQPVTAVTEGAIPAGTFTIFLVDPASGVADQIPNIQNAIKQFASPSGGMMEQVDTIAIYQVGASAAEQLMPPTNFYNGVQNFFVNDLQPITGTTALIDSLASLVDQVDALKPSPDMSTFIVVMSDGTDAISTLSADEIFTRTRALDLPIHTIWVNSTDLTLAGQQQGQGFLQDVSDATQGIATFLDEPEGVATVWDRIAGFRDHARVSYVVEDLTGGTVDVGIALASDPSVRADTSVFIPENQPQVEILIPPESREWSFPSLTEENPVRIQLNTAVSWLDGEERLLEVARLRINGVDVAEIPIEEIAKFTADVPNFVYGANTLEVYIEDEKGLNATNLPVIVNILEGDEFLPDDVKPSSNIGTVLFYLLIILIIVAVIGGIVYFFLRRGGAPGMPRGRSERSQQSATIVTPPGAVQDDMGAAAVVGAAAADQGQSFVMAHLEVLEATTPMHEKINLDGAVVRIGRSPTQADIAFRDDITMSRLHASLMLEGDHYRIFDEKSTSGTWVNGRQVPEYGLQLVDGDEITLGAVHLRFRQL